MVGFQRACLPYSLFVRAQRLTRSVICLSAPRFPIVGSAPKLNSKIQVGESDSSSLATFCHSCRIEREQKQPVDFASLLPWHSRKSAPSGPTLSDLNRRANHCPKQLCGAVFGIKNKMDGRVARIRQVVLAARHLDSAVSSITTLFHTENIHTDPALLPELQNAMMPIGDCFWEVTPCS